MYPVSPANPWLRVPTNSPTMIVRIILALALAVTASAQTISTRTIDTGSGATTGQHISHTTISGYPAMSYVETKVNPTSSEGRAKTILFARNSATDGSGTWTTSRVDTGEYLPSNLQSTLLEIDGKPAIAFHRSDGLWLAKNSAADGSGSWGQTRITTRGAYGPLASAMVAGHPAIAFTESETLYFARCLSTDGLGSWQVHEIDQTENVIVGSLSLAMIAGQPAVSYRADTGPVFMGDYYDFTHTQLRFARSATADGTGTWAVTVAHETTYVDEDTYLQNSLAVIDGKPSVAFYYFGDLYYSRSATGDGSGTWTTTAIETTGTTGLYPTLLTVAGLPTISYYKSTGTDLRVTRCASADGSGTWTSSDVETTGSIGSFAVMTIAAGNPAIAHFDAVARAIKWTRNTLADGSGTWSGIQVDDGSDAGIVGTNAHLVKIDGNPAVSYYDHLNGSFGRNKYARATTSSGLGSAWTVSSPSALTSSNQKVYPLGTRPAFTYFSAGTRNLENSAADGSGTWSSVLIDSAGTASLRGNLAMVGGYPMTVYTANPSNTLKLARNSAADGSGTWSNVTLTSQFTASVPILAEVAGCPAIVYLDPGYNLLLTRNSAPDGTGTWTTTTVATGSPNVRAFFIHGGYPAVVYNRYSSSENLYYTSVAVNSAADGSGTWTETDMFTWSYADYYNGAGSFAMIDGHPALAYVAGSAGELRLRRSSTTAFSGPWESWIIDSSRLTSGPSMLDLGGGAAGIAYQDKTRSSLEYAHLDFSTLATAALRIEKDGGILIPGNINMVFDPTTIHSVAPTQALILTNTSGSPLDITGLTLGGSHASQFTMVGAPTTLAAGASTTVTLGYAPDSTTISSHTATLTITSTDPVVPSVTVTLTGTPAAMDIFQTWQFANFATLVDAGNAAVGADPDSDGISNWLEFCFGTLPNSRNPLGHQFEIVGGNMEITYTRSKDAVLHGVNFEVPWSETLLQTADIWDWYYDEEVQTVISETSTTETVKAVVPMGSAGKRFIRVEAW